MRRRHFIIGTIGSSFLAKFSFAQENGVTIGGENFPNVENFIDSGLRCGTAEPTVFTRQRTMAAYRAFRSADIPLDVEFVVPIHVHVIHDGNKGKISEGRIDDQIKILNSSYNLAKISFIKSSVDYVDNREWYEIGPAPINPFDQNKEAEMKLRLGRDQTSALNLYILKCQNSLLGWATFPWELPINSILDGIVVHNDSLPGGKSKDFSEGHTATHEAAHWLGLFHTFQGGCTEPGDAVDDTPAQESPSKGCPIGRDSCPKSVGLDPISNFMDYSKDSCMNQFTNVQILRMRAFVALFRPNLIPPTMAAQNFRTVLREKIQF